MASGTTDKRTTGGADIAVAPVDPFEAWRELQDRVGTMQAAGQLVSPTADLPVAPPAELDALADLDDPRLVLSESYVGIDRRRPGLRAALSRVFFDPWRRLLRLDVLVVVAVVAVVIGAVLLVSSQSQSRLTSHGADVTLALPSDTLGGLTGVAAAATPTVRSAAAVPAATVATATPATVSQTTVPPTTVPSTVPPTTVPPTTVPPTTPEGMGAAALTLVRYPWQQIPGYSIRFFPISDAPSPGFYGNTDFTWGQKGGVSTLYVYPGETIQQLAGITAFEIGHEVDAAYVEPAGGHAQVAAILGIDPPSWAPECDCAEQGYLSGWYAAAFSDYWSPGVGDWSTLAPPPSGATLAALEPWLDPSLS